MTTIKHPEQNIRAGDLERDILMLEFRKALEDVPEDKLPMVLIFMRFLVFRNWIKSLGRRLIILWFRIARVNL